MIKTSSLESGLQLGAAVALQAIFDLADPDPLRALDALLWWVDPCGGAVWLDCLGDYPYDPDRVFIAMIGGLKHAKRKDGGRSYRGKNKGIDTRPARQFAAGVGK